MERKNLSIITPVYNNLFYTQQCLKSLYDLEPSWNSPDYNIDIVIVDDGSTDGTSDWIKENYPKVHIVYGDGNLWWSGGINKGVKYALDELNADYTLWWNNDVVPKDNYFPILFKILKQNSNDVIIGSAIKFKVRNTGYGLGGIFNPVNGYRGYIRKKELDKDTLQIPIEVDWLPGMGTTIHRCVYEKIGYCDEVLFPQYHGDSDFTLRAKKVGFKLLVFPELIIFNDNSNTGIMHEGSFYKFYKTLTSIRSNYNIKKNILFYVKHSTSKRAYLFVFMQYFGYIGGFFKWKFLSLFGITKS